METGEPQSGSLLRIDELERTFSGSTPISSQNFSIPSGPTTSSVPTSKNDKDYFLLQMYNLLDYESPNCLDCTKRAGLTRM